MSFTLVKGTGMLQYAALIKSADIIISGIGKPHFITADMVKEGVVIIDAGTCIKYDFVDSKKQYKGGNISPGLSMRFVAMHKLTGKLPLVKIHDPGKLIGTSTVTAIQSGVFNGMIEEIKGIISLYKNEYRQVKVILTGGDAHRFAGQLNLSIFAASDLVNIGLNEIIKYNNYK